MVLKLELIDNPSFQSSRPLGTKSSNLIFFFGNQLRLYAQEFRLLTPSLVQAFLVASFEWMLRLDGYL